MSTSEATASRCYHEYCGYPALHELTDYGQGRSGPFNSRNPVYEYRGVWGWCSTHFPEAWSQRSQVSEPWDDGDRNPPSDFPVPAEDEDEAGAGSLLTGPLPVPDEGSRERQAEVIHQLYRRASQNALDCPLCGEGRSMVEVERRTHWQCPALDIPQTGLHRPSNHP